MCVSLLVWLCKHSFVIIFSLTITFKGAQWAAGIGLPKLAYGLALLQCLVPKRKKGFSFRAIGLFSPSSLLTMWTCTVVKLNFQNPATNVLLSCICRVDYCCVYALAAGHRTSVGCKRASPVASVVWYWWGVLSWLYEWTHVRTCVRKGCPIPALKRERERICPNQGSNLVYKARVSEWSLLGSMARWLKLTDRA